MSVTIIGAGLAGLAVAYRLQNAGIEVQVLEARNTPGGRIQAALSDGHQDLGPTWVWPYAQPVVAQWLDELGVSLFDQFDTGSGLLDRQHNESAQQYDIPSQYGIARINGGTYALIDALCSKLANRIRYEHVVTNCVRVNNHWQLDLAATTDTQAPVQINTDQLVIATPPRLAAAMLTTSDDALNKAIQELLAAPTWMASQAKIVIVYETAFWRDAGLSGRIASQVGPLVEVHDHSGPDGTPAALFGFSGVPAQARHNAKGEFIEAIEQQLKRCFGDSAPEPTKIIVKDWAFEPHTTTEADRNGDGAHPQMLSKFVRSAHCQRSLWFGVSETAQRSPGLIEGALARADEVTTELMRG